MDLLEMLDRLMALYHVLFSC